MDNHVKFVCDDCHKTFKNNYNLKVHIDTVHLKTKIFMCKICKKIFSKKSKLKRHSLIHKSNDTHKRELLTLSRGM